MRLRGGFQIGPELRERLRFVIRHRSLGLLERLPGVELQLGDLLLVRQPGCGGVTLGSLDGILEVSLERGDLAE